MLGYGRRVTAQEVREGRVGFRGWATWYRIVGDLHARVPLICVHGGPGSSHHYFARLEALAARGRSVVLYDQVGCGGSTPVAPAELDVSVFVAELANLRDHLGIERAFVLGTSWGGMLAIEYALTRPAGLAGLVLNSTLASVETWAAEVGSLRDALPKELRDALGSNDPDDADYRDAEREFNARHVCRVTDAPELERMQRARSKEVYRALWGPNEWTPTGKLAGWDVRDRLREITVSILLTAGRHDLCTPTVFEELRRGLPHARTFRFENSSHMPQVEEPDAFVVQVEAFLDAHDPPPGGGRPAAAVG